MQAIRRSWLTRSGMIVFIPGTISNVAEFALANTVRQGVLVPIILLALIDVAFIAYFFMHITQLWHPQEE